MSDSRYRDQSDATLLGNFAAQVALDSERGLLDWGPDASAMGDEIRRRMAGPEPTAEPCAVSEEAIPQVFDGGRAFNVTRPGRLTLLVTTDFPGTRIFADVWGHEYEGMGGKTYRITSGTLSNAERDLRELFRNREIRGRLIHREVIVSVPPWGGSVVPEVPECRCSGITHLRECPHWVLPL